LLLAIRGQAPKFICLLISNSKPKGFQMKWIGSLQALWKNYIQIAGIIFSILLITSSAGAESLTYDLIGIGKTGDSVPKSVYEFTRLKVDPTDLYINFDFDSPSNTHMIKKRIHNFEEGEVFLLLRNDSEDENDPAPSLPTGVGFEIRLNF
jgi:hypothetical protein